MRHWTDYDFHPLCPKHIILHESVLNSVHFLCPKQRNKIEGFILFRIRLSNLRQPELYPDIGQVLTCLPHPRVPWVPVACSRRSDSGERCEVKGARKNPLSERLEQARVPVVFLACGNWVHWRCFRISHRLVHLQGKGWSYELPGYQSTDLYSPHPNGFILSLLTGRTWCFTYVVLEWVSSCCPGKIPILKFEVCWDR